MQMFAAGMVIGAIFMLVVIIALSVAHERKQDELERRINGKKAR